MSSSEEKQHHYGIVKKSIQINASKEKVWKKISNIVGLSWLVGVQKTVFLSKNKTGIGAIRKITFDNGNNIREIIVGWKAGQYFSYIATSGLPLRAYHATISIQQLDQKVAKVSWQSFFNSEKMTKKEFSEFQNFMNTFYRDSLLNLKSSLENN
ncbi:MAG TPA: SRPBCC family protein [Nitrosopumilaceae archaeon]|nr:SRPBCC family protein [Nitrosopumilaceae archaeon]